MTQDQWVQVLTFSGGLVLALQTFLLAMPTLSDSTKIIIGAVVALVVAVINLALGVFFKVRKPINTALMKMPPDDVL